RPLECLLKMFAILGELSGIHSLIVRELLQGSSIQLYRTDVLLPRITRVGQEKYRARRFVHSLDSQHLKVTVCKLSFQFCVRPCWVLPIEAVEVEMHVPVTPIRPQERVAGLQETNLHMIEVDPGAGRGLCQND